MPSQLKQQLEAKLHNYGSSNTINLDPITYNSRYPGFDQANYRKLESKADNLGLTGYQREQFMDNLYQQVLPEVQKQIKNSDRRKYINDANYEISQIQDKDAQIQAKSKLAVTEISQKLKEKYNINPSTNDEQLFNDWIKSVPNGNQLFANYLNKGDTELLKKGGLGGDEVDNDSYTKIESKINGALKGDWGRLSTNGLKYVQGWKLILDATELAKAKGATGMNDGEIMRNVIKSSPKLQQKVAELQSLQNSLTEGDKSVLEGKTNGIEVGKAGFSLLPGVSLQFGDDTGMNIALVKDKPASYKEIQDLIDVKEKFGDNYVGEVGNVAKVFASQPIDTLKKKGNQTLNELDNIGTNMESFWNDIMPKRAVEAMQGREMTDDELEQYKQNVAAEYDARKNKNKEQVLKYNDKINKAFQKQVEMNLDPQIKEYYDDKTITELLALGDMKGVGYKQAQMVASNWDMLPNIVVSAINTPAGLTLMFGDSYARESQDSFERLMEAGADYDQASGISKVVGVINGAVEVGLDRLFGGVETTASKNLKNAFMNNLTEEATKKGFWNILGGIAKRQIGSSLEEGAEEVIQEIVSNAAEMTIKDNPEFADLFKGVWEAFEGGVFNPMNLMAGGTDIAANKGNIQQSLLDASYDAGVTTRNIVDAGENMKNNVREFMLDGAYNAGKGARNIVERADKVKEFMSRKKGQNVTTENVESENIETESTPITPQGTETAVDETIDANSPLAVYQQGGITKLNNSIKDANNPMANMDGTSTTVDGDVIELIDDESTTDSNTTTDLAETQGGSKFWEAVSGLEDNIKEKIKRNPYAIEESRELIKNMEDNPGLDFTEYQNERYESVLDMIEERLKQAEDKRRNDVGGLYTKLEEANAPIDTTNLKNRVAEYQARVEELGDILSSSDKAKIETILKNIQEIGDGTMDIWKVRKIADQWAKYDQGATGDGIRLIRDIRNAIDDEIMAQNPEMKEVDQAYKKAKDEIQDLRGNLTYKKTGEIKSNAVSTVKNMLNANNKKYLSTLEKYIPGITERLQAIRDSKLVYNAYTSGEGSRFVSKGRDFVTKGILAGGGYLLGGPVGAGIGYLISGKVDAAITSLARKGLKETITKETAESKAELERINKKIEENQRLEAEEKAKLRELGDRIMQKVATMDKTDAEQSAWNDWLADLEQDEVIDMPEEVYDQWEEVTTTPKKKTTKKKTSKKSENKTETIDKNTQEKIDAYEKEINEIVKPYRMADNSVNLSDFMKDKKAYSKYTKIMDEIRKLQGYMTEDGMYTQKRYDMLNERKEKVYGKQVSTWAETEDEVKSKKKTNKKS